MGDGMEGERIVIMIFIISMSLNMMRENDLVSEDETDLKTTS